MFDEVIDFILDHCAQLVAVLGFVLVFYVPIGLIGWAASGIL